MNSEIDEIFQNLQNLNVKNLDFQVKICFAEGNLPQGRTDFTETSF